MISFLVVGRVKIVGQTFKLLRSYVAARPTVGRWFGFVSCEGEGGKKKTERRRPKNEKFLALVFFDSARSPCTRSSDLRRRACEKKITIDWPSASPILLWVTIPARS